MKRPRVPAAADSVWVPWALAALGTLFAFHPTLLSGFARVQTDIGDTVLNHYILEHEYRWLTGVAGAEKFWDPPIFHPTANALAYTDVLLGAAPLYWIWRALGLEADTSLQLWMIALLALDYCAAYLWLRRCFGVRRGPASLGAFVFGFAGSRLAQLGHQQLQAQFYLVGAVHAATRALEGAASSRKRRAWVAVFFLCGVAQVHSGFYMGWFLAFATACVTLAAVARPDLRRRLVAFVRAEAAWICACAALAIAATWPLASHYLEAAREKGFRSWDEVRWLVPPVQAWFYLGPGSWLYSWMPKVKMWGTIAVEAEQRIGLGLVTTAVAACGVARAWRARSSVRALALGFLLVFVLVTKFPPGYWTLWEPLFHWIPGAGAVRALSRVGLLMLVPAAAGVALFFERRSRGGLAGGALLALLVVLEQGRSTPSYDKEEARARVRQVAAAVTGGCGYFFYSPLLPPETPDRATVRHQLDGMWAQLLTGVPTLNGYSGNLAPGWSDLFESGIVHPEDESKLKARLDDWIERKRLDPKRFCWVRLPL